MYAKVGFTAALIQCNLALLNVLYFSVEKLYTSINIALIIFIQKKIICIITLSEIFLRSLSIKLITYLLRLFSCKYIIIELIFKIVEVLFKILKLIFKMNYTLTPFVTYEYLKILITSRNSS